MPTNESIRVSLLLVPHRAEQESRSEQTMGRMLEVVEVAHVRGFHACYFPEHHLRDDDYVTSPLTVAAFAAGRFPGLRVGTSVALPALHNPLTFAEQLATIDVISEGRLDVIGLGLGNVPQEFRAIGVPHDEMLARFTGAIDVVRRLWRGERVTADVGSLHLEDAALSARSERGEAPLAIGAMSDRGVRRAAELGLPWLTDPMHPLERLEEWADLYWRHAGPEGRIILMRQAWPTGTIAEAEARWWPHARDQIFTFSLAHDRLRGEAGLEDVRTPADLPFDRFAPRFLLGTPTEIVGRAHEVAARLRASDVIVRMGFGTGPDHPQVIEAVDALGVALATQR